MKKGVDIIVVIISAICLFASCKNDIQYSQFRPISSMEWHVDSCAEYDYLINDTTGSYDVLIYVRHTERYPYQNMWLFVQNDFRRDTIEFYLADDRGRWLGNRHNGFIEMPVLLETDYHYPDSGMYHLIIQHGMRDSLLRGVADVGVEVIKLRGER